jgi:hypothetical protein
MEKRRRFVQSLRLAATSGELPEWVDHANEVIEQSQAYAAAAGISIVGGQPGGLLLMVKQQIEAVRASIRGGRQRPDGPLMNSQFVSAYGGSAEAIAARAAKQKVIASGGGGGGGGGTWAVAEVGTGARTVLLLAHFLSFPYVCPEPVLVKGSCLYINALIS